jgi:hypothetical protein
MFSTPPQQEQLIMAIPLTNLKGIGPSTATDLIAAGIGCVEDLARASVEQITRVKGIGQVRAIQLREAAQTLQGPQEDAPTPAPAAPEAEPGAADSPAAAATEKSDKPSKKKEKATAEDCAGVSRTKVQDTKAQDTAGESKEKDKKKQKKQEKQGKQEKSKSKKSKSKSKKA